MRCTNCNKEIPDGVKFCPECGSLIQTAKFCPNCGNEITPGTKFCPNCGTACNSNDVAVQDNHNDDDIFIISRQNFDEAVVGNDYHLISFDETESSNSNIADVIIDDEGDVVIKAFSRGNVCIAVAFSYCDDHRNCDSMVWHGFFHVDRGNVISFDHGEFVTDDDSDNSNDGSGLGSLIGGLASFAGAFAGGFLEGLAASGFDDDDD